jgi:predicted AlkP superfamily phosphohydrolase/phosphomutase
MIDRREFLKLGLGAASALALGGDGAPVLRAAGRTATARKVIVLGFDGMDPHLVKVWMDEGKLPAFRKLAALGGFSPLRTSVPPQSPVAWSNFIAGTNPGGHGIFDFIHRDAASYIPTFSASATTGSTKTVRIGDIVLPLSGGSVTNLRKGKAFWQTLEEHDIPATIFKIPSNYPPVATKQRTISGMGTPDIKGYYGLFNYYTNEYREITQEAGGGGRVHEVYVIGNRVEAQIPGPTNSFRREGPETLVDFKVFLDPEHPVAKIVIQDQEFILKEKEWSGWKKVSFGLIPTQSVSGICMFYLKEVRPKFKLYVSPINIDPANPALPITTPESYAKDLAKKFGPFFTKGLPADTSALDNLILDEGEFLEQDDMVLRESLAMYEDELRRFESGLLFYYFSNTDQRQHMFWRLIDPQHPAYDAGLAAKYGNVIENIYVEMDRVLARTMERTGPDTSLIVMSDHGFNPFRRGFNLNTWLKENGYHRLVDDRRQADTSLFENTDWSRSRAYGIGLNGLYLNRRGREKQGIVAAGAEADNLVREIARKLEEVVDPATGERAILKAYVAKDVYQGPFVDQAPDIILGFNRGIRISWQSPLGSFPKEIFENNTQKWSGDHMSAAEVIPGILLANRAIVSESPALFDLTATILAVFGIAPTEGMIGKNVLKA